MYIRYGFLILTAVVLVAVAIPVLAEPADPPPDGLLRDGVCPVTKLKAKDYPAWQVCCQDHEGNWRVFVGMKSFLEYVNDPEEYVGQKIDPGGLAIVRDYTTNKWIQSVFAYFVFGEKIVGPNGKDVVAFEDKKKAEKYAGKMHAAGIVRFLGLRKSVIAYLNDTRPDSADADSIIVPQIIDMKNAPPGVQIK